MSIQIQRFTRIISMLISSNPNLNIFTKEQLYKEINIYATEIYNKQHVTDIKIKSLQNEIEKLKQIKCKKNYY